MKVEKRVQRIYERRPYPPLSLRKHVDRWVLPPLEWIRAVAPPDGPAVKRILVAGCGVGSEAFAFARRFPSAEVIGVDFSPRSIATARRLQKSARGGDRMRFELADLTSDTLVAITEGGFDLVSCHGVLSYIAEPVGVLRNFVRCMKRSGTLVLGVNGASHPSLRFRRSLPSFGIDPDEFHESRRVRDVLALHDSVSSYPPLELAGQAAGYLASDIFSPLNHSLPLVEWSRLARQSGLHLRANYYATYGLRGVLNRGQQNLLMPRSRAEVSELFDVIQPGSFHRVVYSRQEGEEPPWSDGRSLPGWRPLATKLFTARYPRAGGAWHQLKDVVLESVPMNAKVTLRIPRWEVAILTESDGKKSLREILDRVKPRVTGKELSEQLYVLHQLGVLNLLPA